MTKKEIDAYDLGFRRGLAESARDLAAMNDKVIEAERREKAREEYLREMLREMLEGLQ